MTAAAAVLFDLDGVLIDSEPIWYDVELAIVERLGGVWDKSHQARCVGGTVDATCRYILALTGSDRTEADLQEEILASMAARFRESLVVHDGALELVDAVRGRGARTALVSSSYRVLVDAALDWLGRDRFDVTIAGDEVRHGKPSPEPYRAACARLGIDPAHTVVVEDTVSGVTSAEAAGCWVVAVPSVAPIPATPRRPSVRAVRDIDPDWLLALPGSLARDSAQHVEA
jgi:HAD superfamily hydrolase (TIGR01509 family)